MSADENAILIAPCGMNCALCSGYLALKNDFKSKGVKIPYCKGCRPRDKQCSFIKKRCSKLMNKDVQFCFECADFPCKNLAGLDKKYKDRFRMSMIENLKTIKEKGMEAFLKGQKEKWKCPECGEMICCHNGLCYNCDLEKIEAKKKKYERES